MSINPASCFSRRVQQERADSPGPSCVSIRKSDHSMELPVNFKDGNQSIEKRSGLVRDDENTIIECPLSIHLSMLNLVTKVFELNTFPESDMI